VPAPGTSATAATATAASAALAVLGGFVTGRVLGLAGRRVGGWGWLRIAPAAVALLLLASAFALPLPILGGLAELTEHLLQTLDLALVGDLLDFGVLDELEHLFHVGERALESVHDAFDLENGLFDGTR